MLAIQLVPQAFLYNFQHFLKGIPIFRGVEFRGYHCQLNLLASEPNIRDDSLFPKMLSSGATW